MTDHIPAPSLRPADSSAVPSSLDPAHQHIADDIYLWLGKDQPDVDLTRRCAEQAVVDLRHSISLESLPEMATRLAMVRLTEVAGALPVEL